MAAQKLLLLNRRFQRHSSIIPYRKRPRIRRYLGISAKRLAYIDNARVVWSCQKNDIFQVEILRVRTPKSQSQLEYSETWFLKIRHYASAQHEDVSALTQRAKMLHQSLELEEEGRRSGSAEELDTESERMSAGMEERNEEEESEEEGKGERRSRKTLKWQLAQSQLRARRKGTNGFTSSENSEVKEEEASDDIEVIGSNGETEEEEESVKEGRRRSHQSRSLDSLELMDKTVRKEQAWERKNENLEIGGWKQREKEKDHSRRFRLRKYSIVSELQKEEEEEDQESKSQESGSEHYVKKKTLGISQKFKNRARKYTKRFDRKSDGGGGMRMKTLRLISSLGSKDVDEREEEGVVVEESSDEISMFISSTSSEEEEDDRESSSGHGRSGSDEEHRGPRRQVTERSTAAGESVVQNRLFHKRALTKVDVGDTCNRIDGYAVSRLVKASSLSVAMVAFTIVTASLEGGNAPVGGMVTTT